MFWKDLDIDHCLKKEIELLNKNFGYKDIDELEVVLNDAEAKEEYDQLVNFFGNRVNIFKKLVKTLEVKKKKKKRKKRINNVIRAVNIIFNVFLDQDKASESDSFNNETNFDFSSVKGEVLTPSQILSRLPISLAQSNAGNNSGKTQK